jgi:hypothetical protein
VSEALAGARPSRVLVEQVVLSATVVALVAGIGASDHGRFLKLAVEAIIAALAALLCSRRAATALGVLVVFLPLQIIGLAWLYHLGLPGSVVRGLGSLKDVLVIAIVLAAIRAHQRTRRRFDLADICLLAYVGVATLYLALPRLLPSQFTVLPFSVISLAWRTDVLFAVLLIALRHLPMATAARARIELAIIVVGLIVAGGAYWEYFAPSGWYHFLSTGPHVPEYLTQILKSPATLDSLVRRTAVGSTEQVRPGSLLFEPVDAGFYLLLPLGLLLRGISARRSRLSIPAMAVVAGALILTLTRSAVLSAVVVVFVFICYATAGRHSGRTRILIVIVTALIAAIPLASVTKLAARSTSATNGSDVSTRVHASDLQRGLDRMSSNPFGQGLGTVAGIGSRFQVANRITSENSYIQVGNEIGVMPLVFFAAFLLALMGELHRRARAPVPDADRAAAAAAILAGLIVGGFFQELWLDFSQTLTAATILGMASVSAHRDPVSVNAARSAALAGDQQPIHPATPLGPQ